MTRRLAKQLVYGGLFLLFWTLIGVGLYAVFGRTPPSCTDGIQNQNEEGIDCGGVCSRFCVSGLAPISAETDVYAFAPTASQIELFAQIGNSNADYAAKSFSYVWHVTDAKGETHDYPGESYIYAGEIKYIAGVFDAAAYDPAGATATITINSRSADWLPKEEFVQPTLKVQDLSGAYEGGQIAVRGKVLNSDAGPVARVFVIAILYGSRGQVVGVAPTMIAQLEPNESAPFVILHPKTPESDLTRTKIFLSAYRP